MKGAKVSKLASIKSATECSVAFSKLLKEFKRVHKDFMPHANHDAAMRKVYYMAVRVIDTFYLQHIMFPLQLTDFTIRVDNYFVVKQDICLMAIDCMNPLIKRLPKLNQQHCVQLVNTMRNHLRAYVVDDLGVALGGAIYD